MLTVSLFGAGFVGRVHAENLARHPRVRFHSIVDPDAATAEPLAQRYGARWFAAPEPALEDAAVDAVVIATPASTHVGLTLAAAAAGKAILCEKPLATTVEDADACLAGLVGFRRPLLVGFNRRFDPNHRALGLAVKAGAVGRVEQVNIVSRDPHPLPVSYMRATPGGVFYDTMIHDFDMARWLLGEEPIEVYAAASALVEEELNPDRDLDTALAVLKTASGAMCQITVSRRAVYGYDQRIEVFGSGGMLQSGNVQRTTVRRYDAAGIHGEVLLNFFIDRYREAFVAELDHFVEAALTNRPAEIGAYDGRQSLVLALAALDSARTGRPVPIAPTG